jgi:peptide/nickel transport system permease protein
MVVLAWMLLALAGFGAVVGWRLDPKRPTSVIEWGLNQDADRTAPADRLLGPVSRGQDGRFHLLGTDEIGRDLSLRLVVALGTSFAIAGLGVLVAMSLGTAMGITSGLAPPRLDGVLMRITEATAGVPNILVILVLAAVFSRWGSLVVCAAMGLLFWQTVARVVRARVLRLRAEPYLEASRALGTTGWYRIRRHLLPGVWPVVLVQGSLLLPRLVLLEALLSFLGVGGLPPHSFGRIIAGVTSTLTPLTPTWWPVVIPCLLLTLLLIAASSVLDGRERFV